MRKSNTTNYLNITFLCNVFIINTCRNFLRLVQLRIRKQEVHCINNHAKLTLDVDCTDDVSFKN